MVTGLRRIIIGALVVASSTFAVCAAGGTVVSAQDVRSVKVVNNTGDRLKITLFHGKHVVFFHCAGARGTEYAPLPPGLGIDRIVVRVIGYEGNPNVLGCKEALPNYHVIWEANAPLPEHIAGTISKTNGKYHWSGTP